MSNSPGNILIVKHIGVELQNLPINFGVFSDDTNLRQLEDEWICVYVLDRTFLNKPFADVSTGHYIFTLYEPNQYVFGDDS